MPYLPVRWGGQQIPPLYKPDMFVRASNAQVRYLHSVLLFFINIVDIDGINSWFCLLWFNMLFYKKLVENSLYCVLLFFINIMDIDGINSWFWLLWFNMLFYKKLVENSLYCVLLFFKDYMIRSKSSLFLFIILCTFNTFLVILWLEYL